MKSITICNLEEEYEEAAQLVENMLQRKRISRVIRTETMMVFEALYHNLQQNLPANLLKPLEQLFANAMVMIAAPVTFFSLLKNRTNAYIVSEWNDNVRRLHRTATVSSIVAVLLAMAAAVIVSELMDFRHNLLANVGSLNINYSLAELISGLMPSNIFEPFITISPFPLIIIALMVAYALFSAGKYFDLINQLINAFYVVFSKILGMIMFTMPFFIEAMFGGLQNLVNVAGDIITVVVDTAKSKKDASKPSSSSPL